MSMHPPLAPLAVDIVSVQSQVVYGRVGNNVAVPTFEQAGWRVAAVPSVILSNTPHYPTLHGGPIPDDWFAGWLEDLVGRGALAGLRAVQAGYLGSPGQARILAKWLAGMRERRPGLQVCIDPVIGDSDVGIYVDPALVATYREGLLAQADGLTPNAFELGQLAGMPVDSFDALVPAARSLLRGRVRWIVATSALPQDWPPGRMRMALVTPDDARLIEHKHVDARPKGTGDLFSASLACNLLQGLPLQEAVQLAGDAVVRVLRRTHHAGVEELLLQD